MKTIFALPILLIISTISYAEIVSYNLITAGKNISIPVASNQADLPIPAQVTPCKSCTIHHLAVDENSTFYHENMPMSIQDFSKFMRENPNKEIRLQYNRKDKTIYYMSWNSRSKDVEQ